MPGPSPTVQIRDVWENNLIEEFEIIKSVIGDFPYVAFDTEFPGFPVEFVLPRSLLVSDALYLWIKINVDNTKLLRVGLTLSDACGNLPTLNTNSCFAWQFNFRNFSPERDLFYPLALEKLLESKIDLDKHSSKGIDSNTFGVFLGYLLMKNRGCLTWISFEGPANFAHLIKVITQNRPLPSTLKDFLKLLVFYFGLEFYDTSHLVRFSPNVGQSDEGQSGLDVVRSRIGVSREVGENHQVCSNSLVMLRLFLKLKEQLGDKCSVHSSLLRGLEFFSTP